MLQTILPVSPPNEPLRELLAEELAAVEKLLHANLNGPFPLLHDVSAHVVDAGGKRLRPVLCLLAARAAGVPVASAVTVATAAELLHTASLLHDDVVDQATIRRGKPAAPRVFGNSVCVLCGDALMAVTLSMLAGLGDHRPLSSSARCLRRMALGEVQQMIGIPAEPAGGLLPLLRIIEGKTAGLFAWCATIGDLCPPKHRSALASFGRRLGMAFQIADDTLDLDGDPRRTGKEPGSDLRAGTMTVPIFLACQQQPQLREELEALGSSPSAASVATLIGKIRESGGLERARVIARALLTRAHSAVDELSPSIWRQHLHELADSVLERTS